MQLKSLNSQVKQNKNSFFYFFRVDSFIFIHNNNTSFKRQKKIVKKVKVLLK